MEAMQTEHDAAAKVLTTNIAHRMASAKIFVRRVDAARGGYAG